MFVYSWASEDIPDSRRGIYLGPKQEFRNIHQALNCKTNDSGIFNMLDLDDVSSSFDECLHRSFSIVPNHKKSSTLISLGATGTLISLK
jgi:hypothetical protein